MANRWENSDRLSSWAPTSQKIVTAAIKLKDTCFLEEKLWQTQHIKRQRHYFINKHSSSQSYGSSSVWWVWELDYKESCVLKNLCLWTVVFEKILESPLDGKVKLVHPKGNWRWVFIGRIDAEAETPILWQPDANSLITGKDPDAGKDRRQEEKGMTEDEMVGWHHQLNGHEFERAPGVSDGQEGLACCSPWGHRVSHDWTTELNW